MLLRRSAIIVSSKFARPLVSTSSARGVSSFAPAPGRGFSRAVQTLLPGASVRHSTSTVPGEGDEVRPTPQPKESGIQPAKEQEVRNPALHQKWGWSASTDRLYYPLKALGVFSKKNTNALSSGRMLQTCLNNAERREWYEEGKISNEFLPKLLWLSTNVWMLSRRLLREGERGKRVQELLFDELWRETKRQMRSIKVTDIMLKKYLAEAQQHTFITLVQYDHAYTVQSREERMDLLTSALWRGVYMSDESIKEPHVRVMAEYIDSELHQLYEIDALDFFAVCMELAPPPAELKASKKLSKRNAKKSPKGGKESSAKAPLDKSREGVVDGMAVPNEGGREVFDHQDFGKDMKGRWRSCLAESGKVYYWHTVSREVTWTKPAECDAYVPSIMPKTAGAVTA